MASPRSSRSSTMCSSPSGCSRSSTLRLPSRWSPRLLAIVGYSLNDTIVVFDRIRENLHTARRQGFDGTVNQSINECLSRTLITSATTLMAVLVLMIFGGEVNRDFTITLMIGVVIGTYSSIFVASPVLYLGQRRAAAKEAN